MDLTTWLGLGLSIHSQSFSGVCCETYVNSVRMVWSNCHVLCSSVLYDQHQMTLLLLFGCMCNSLHTPSLSMPLLQRSEAVSHIFSGIVTFLFLQINTCVSVWSIYSFVGALVGSSIKQQETEAWGISTTSKNILSRWCSTSCQCRAGICTITAPGSWDSAGPDT